VVDVSLARTATGTLTIQAESGLAAGTGGLSLFPGNTPTAFTSGGPPTMMLHNTSTYTMNYGNGNVGNLIAFTPTLVFQQAGNGLGSGVGFAFAPSVKNLAGSAVGIGLFTAIQFAPTFTADTSTVANMGTAIGFISSPTTSVVNAGVITAMTLQGFRSQASVGASTTVGTLTHFQANDASGAGAVTTQIGLDIAAFAKATTNMGIRNASTTMFTPTANQTLAAATTVNPNATAIAVIQTSGANITLTAAPTITAGTTGQVLVITNVSTVAGSTFTFQSVSSLAGSTLSLGATTRVVGLKGSLTLQWNATLTRWVEIGFNAGGFG
jgi:hypothetical protein